MNKNRNFEELFGQIGIGYNDTPTSNNKHFHVHDAYEVTLILSKEVRLEVNNEAYTVPYGSLLIFNTADLHRITFLGDDTYKRWVIWVKHEFLCDFGNMLQGMLHCFFAKAIEKPNMLTLSGDQLSLFISLAQSLKALSEGENSLTLIKLKLGELLTYVNLWYGAKKENKISLSANGLSYVYDAILYIQENYYKKLTRSTLESLVGVDEKTLCNKFKEITGKTTFQFVLGVRLNNAKAMLIQGVPVTEVCEKCGFENWSNFSRTFKNHVGISPKKYALLHRGG